MSYTINQDKARQAVMGSIVGLMQDLQKLSPHPDQPHNKGPLFIKSNPNFKVANDHDGMLGGMMMESILSSAFSEAVSETLGSWTQEFDATAALDCYSEYLTDVQSNSQKSSAHGQGTLARLSSNPISGSFNMRSDISSEMQEFMNDLPQRMKIEHNLAYYAKKLEVLDAAPVTKHQYSDASTRFAA